jgi:hypothetical protein
VIWFLCKEYGIIEITGRNKKKKKKKERKKEVSNSGPAEKR